MAAMASRVLNSQNNLIAIVLFIGIGISCEEPMRRHVQIEYNPGCSLPECKTDIQGDFVSVYHISAIGATDSIHYLISNIGSPSVLTARFDTPSIHNLTIDWQRLLSNNSDKMSNSILYYPKPVYSSAIIFDQLIEYNDVNDTTQLNMNSPGNVSLHSFNDFTWKDGSELMNLMENSVELLAYSDDPIHPNGSISFKFNFFLDDGHQDILPHLQFNSNLTQIDFQLDSMQSSFNKSRFGLSLQLISNDFISRDMPIKTIKSLDDEHSPGVFKIVNWRTHENDSTGNYVQWKPIAYTKNERLIKYGVNVQDYESTDSTSLTLNKTIVWAFYGYNLNNIASSAVNVTFGMPGDGFYLATNFTAWSLNFGYGDPPFEEFSTVMIVVIALGLGLPFLLIVIGSVITCVCRGKRENLQLLGYAEITT